MPTILLTSVVCLSVPCFFHIMAQTARFSGENIINRKTCVLICSTTFVRKVSRYRKRPRGIIINVHRPSCKVPFTYVVFRQILKKFSNVKFHKNSSSRSRVVPCGHTDRQTDRLAKIIVTFRNFAKAPKHVIWETYFAGKIRRRHFPNTSVQCCHYTTLEYKCTVLPLQHTARLI
jgi:hypothetical protein